MSTLRAMRLLTAGFLLALVLTGTFHRWGQAQETFSPYVDVKGGISVPPNYRTRWVFLGT